nr:uncharacterized protein LOC109119455 [Solanum lycopersicum]
MEKVNVIQEMLKTAQSRPKSYTNVKRRISNRVENVAYELELPQKLATVHPIFHVSMLKKCLGDPSLIVPTDNFGITYEGIPVQILDREVRKLITTEVESVKVLSRNKFVEDETWEAEEDMKKRYLHVLEYGVIADQGT